MPGAAGPHPPATVTVTVWAWPWPQLLLLAAAALLLALTRFLRGRRRRLERLLAQARLEGRRSARTPD